jgi:predicted phage terminase large subunit-like protein
VKPKELRERYIDGHLDPIRLSAEILKKEKRNLGSYMYSAQFDQDPIPMEGNIIKKKWFRRFNFQGLAERAKKEQEEIVWNFVIDSAYTNNEDNAASAMLSYCKLFGNLYIRNITEAWLEFPEMVKWIEEVAKNNGYDWRSAIRIEPKASGLSAAQSMNRETTLNVMLAKSPVTDKVARAVSCTPTIEAGRVYLLEGADWVEEFLKQCSGFPNMKLKDQVDCLTMAIDESVMSEDSVIIL